MGVWARQSRRMYSSSATLSTYTLMGMSYLQMAQMGYLWAVASFQSKDYDLQNSKILICATNVALPFVLMVECASLCLDCAVYFPSRKMFLS